MPDSGQPLLLGCSKCRYASKGCAQCRNPDFKGRRGSRPGKPKQEAQCAQADIQPPTGHEPQTPPSTLKAAANVDQAPPSPEGAQTAVKRSRYFSAGGSPDQQGSDNPKVPPPVSETSIPAEAAHPTASPDPQSSPQLDQATSAQDAAQHASDVSASSPAPTVSDGTACNDGSQSDFSDFRSRLQERILQNKSSPRKLVLHRKRQAPDSSKPDRKRIKVVKKVGLQVLSGDPKQHVWDPPASPFGLIEEVLYQDPWRLLLACMLLNKTSGRAVRRVIWELFKMCPDAASAAQADVAAIERLIYPLGLATKRAAMVIRFSQEYLDTEWTTPMQLHGIGQYATDAYFMFCRGDWRKVQPLDKDLLKYHAWLEGTDGHGSGLQRESAFMDCKPELHDAGPAVEGPEA